MEINSDIILRGEKWNKAIEELNDVFPDRTNYDVYILSLSLGIMYDKRIAKFDDEGYDPKNVPRNVIQNNDNGKMDFFFQSAILSTESESFTEEKRLELAFNEKTDFNKVGFLTEFANYGVTRLVDLLGITSLDSIDNILSFMMATVEGKNIDIDGLPDDVLLED